MCVCVPINQAIIGSDNNLSPDRRQAIVWTNTGMILIEAKSWEQIPVKFETKYRDFHTRKLIWNCRLRNGGHFVPASMC